MDPPLLCAKGCGFYGSVENKNMCSKCFKDYLKEEVISKTELHCVVDDNLSIPTTSSYVDVHHHPSPPATVITEDFAGAKKRCKVEICKKKVGLTGFRCRCGGVFCPKHRYPEEHSCDVDFKKAGRDLLAKQNALCIGDKMQWRLC